MVQLLGFVVHSLGGWCVKGCIVAAKESPACKRGEPVGSQGTMRDAQQLYGLFI